MMGIDEIDRVMLPGWRAIQLWGDQPRRRSGCEFCISPLLITFYGSSPGTGR
jgi:hypothetical protein